VIRESPDQWHVLDELWPAVPAANGRAAAVAP
jgi:hypothetical protein